MKEEKLEIQDVLRRLDELLRILKFLSEDLAEISKNLKATLNSPVPEMDQPISFSQDETSSVGGTLTVEGVQRVFPQELSRMVYFEVTEDYVLVKPRQYLGPENFSKIATIVRDRLNGEYVSMGRDSHFRIPRKP